MTEKQFATWLIGHLFEIGPDGLKTPDVLAREVLEAARSVPCAPSPAEVVGYVTPHPDLGPARQVPTQWQAETATGHSLDALLGIWDRPKGMSDQEVRDRVFRSWLTGSPMDLTPAPFHTNGAGNQT